MKLKEYAAWKKENEDFFKLLEAEKSILLDRLKEVFLVLDKIVFFDEIARDTSEYQVFFEVGYSYVFDRMNEIKIYFEEYFHGSKMLFKKYELLISYLMYMEDYREVLIEKSKISIHENEMFDKIFKEIEDILKKNKDFSLSLLDNYDFEIQKMIKYDKEILTILDIFSLAYEEMQ